MPAFRFRFAAIFIIFFSRFRFPDFSYFFRCRFTLIRRPLAHYLSPLSSPSPFFFFFFFFIIS